MKDPILEQLAAYKGPARLPPIADRAFALYASGGFILNDESVGALRVELDSYGDDLKALTDAICGLGAFALYVRDVRKDPATADVVVHLIGEYAPKYQSIGERIVAALQDLAIKATDLLDKFSDREAPEKGRAPVFDEAPPPGAVPLKNLKPLHEEPRRRILSKKR